MSLIRKIENRKWCSAFYTLELALIKRIAQAKMEYALCAGLTNHDIHVVAKDFITHGRVSFDLGIAEVAKRVMDEDGAAERNAFGAGNFKNDDAGMGLLVSLEGRIFAKAARERRKFIRLPTHFDCLPGKTIAHIDITHEIANSKTNERREREHQTEDDRSRQLSVHIPFYHMTALRRVRQAHRRPAQGLQEAA